MAERSLGKRLSRTLLLQVLFISLATVLGVYVARTVLEDVLIRQALTDEAQFYWEQRSENPDFPLPATRNLTGHMGQVPTTIAGLEEGFHNLQQTESQLVLVSERDGARLFLVYDGRRVNELALYFGLVPLVLVLLVLYLSSWLGFRASQRAISPVIALAREVQNLDPEHPDPAHFDPEHLGTTADDEVRVLAAAMTRFTTRLNDFIERERNFTRDASHELRSPLTVIRMAAEILDGDPGLSDRGRRALSRIRRAATDMEELTGAFLLLAREAESGLPSDELCVNAIAAEELARASAVAGDKPIGSHFDEQCRLFVVAPEKVLAVMIGNLLRNAFSYTEAGEVSLIITAGQVTIQDSGVGMTAEQINAFYRPFVRGDGAQRGGFGVGLTIVKRLSDRFEWPLHIDSEPGVGTRVVVAFPASRTEPLAPAPAA